MAYGVKNPLQDKAPKIEQYGAEKRYYPQDRRGNVDEWGAIQKHRNEVYQREQAEAQLQKALHQKDYARELERAMQ